MHNIDSFLFRYSTLTIIIAGVFYYFSLEYLLDNGNSASSVMIYRGILTMALTSLIAYNKKQSLFPQKIHLQFLRLVNSGIALLLVFEAYKHLAAATIAMVGRLDIPFAVLIGLIAGKQKWNTKTLLSILAIFIVISTLFYSDKIDENPMGIILSLISVVLTSCAYLLVKNSTKHENDLAILNTTNIGCILVGLISGYFRNNLSDFQWQFWWVLIIAAFSQFLLNYMLVGLYRKKEVVTAQRPFLLCTIFVIGVEQVLEHKFFDPLHIFIILVVVGIIYLITLENLPGMAILKSLRVKLQKSATILPFENEIIKGEKL